MLSDLLAGARLAGADDRRGVQRTPEFERIAALPRRVWRPDSAERCATAFTERLATSRKMALWPIQAVALAEIEAYRGGFLPIGVGRGKALISLLAPVVLDAQRPLLLVPAALREQTKRKVLPEMSPHWRLHPRLEVRGYSEISIASGARLLDRIEPDVIILDEGHALSAAKSARTRRVTRYLRAHPETTVVVMSGTVTKRSIMDYWHLLHWCLGERGSPLPKAWPEARDWADALDSAIDAPLDPGILLDLCEPDESPREGYHRRLVETPGVIASKAGELGIALSLRSVLHTPAPASLDLLGSVRDGWEDPNGDPLMRAVDVWRLCRQLALGFWYRWDPLPPQPWMDARREWGYFVREKLKRSHRLDSPLQVWNECLAATVPPDEWLAWRDIKDTFRLNTVPTWVDDTAIERCAAWLAEGPGIVWTEQTAFAERVAAHAGVPYFGAGAEASSAILDASGPIVASIRAHGTGKNLQHAWYRNLITSPPGAGRDWEQLIGRTHRAGQKADRVEVDVLMAAPESWASMDRARADAHYLQETLGDRQRLLYADTIGFEGSG